MSNRLSMTAPTDANGRQIQKFMDQYEFSIRTISADLEVTPEYILSVHTDGGFVIQKHFFSSATVEEMLYYKELPGRVPRTVFETLRLTLTYVDFEELF